MAFRNPQLDKILSEIAKLKEKSRLEQFANWIVLLTFIGSIGIFFIGKTIEINNIRNQCNNELRKFQLTNFYKDKPEGIKIEKSGESLIAINANISDIKRWYHDNDISRAILGYRGGSDWYDSMNKIITLDASYKFQIKITWIYLLIVVLIAIGLFKKLVMKKSKKTV